MAKKHTSISLNMIVSDSEEALGFYRRVFGAKSSRDELFFDTVRGGKSALFSIGDSLFAISDEKVEIGARSPITFGGTPVVIQIFVENVAEVINRALDEGAELSLPSTDEVPIVVMHGNVQFGNVTDPFCYVWSITKG